MQKNQTKDAEKKGGVRGVTGDTERSKMAVPC